MRINFDPLIAAFLSFFLLFVSLSSSDNFNHHQRWETTSWDWWKSVCFHIPLRLSLNQHHRQCWLPSRALSTDITDIYFVVNRPLHLKINEHDSIWWQLSFVSFLNRYVSNCLRCCSSFPLMKSWTFFLSRIDRFTLHKYTQCQPRRSDAKWNINNRSPQWAIDNLRLKKHGRKLSK